MNLVNYISEKVILRCSDLLTGQSVAKKYRFLMESQFWSKEQLVEFQNFRLRQLVKHAVETVPYYTELFTKHRLKVSDIQTISDLYKIPILTKATIKSEGISKFTAYSFPRNKVMNASSSGSTGEPLFYLRTKESYSMGIATSLRGWNWMGYNLGDKYVKMSQNPRLNPVKKLQDYATNNLYLSTNPLQDSNFEFILEKIENYQPKIIRCYPDPLLLLARFKRKNSKYRFRPNAITTTGNTLFPETRKEIEEAFGCKIFDAYSCEGNSTVFECQTHECYHSSEEYGITEIIDGKGNKIDEGIGTLISTDLWNFVHPFIRYDTQDSVEISKKECTCGRKLLRVNKILGRNNDMIDTPSGRIFIVHNFTGYFQTDNAIINRSINKFQVVKKQDGSVTFRLVVNDRYNNSIEQFIVSTWQKELKMPVKVEVVNEIPLTQSGKWRFIIRENEEI